LTEGNPPVLQYHPKRIFKEEENMKKLLALGLSLAMVLSLAACGNSNSSNDSTGDNVQESSAPVETTTTPVTTGTEPVYGGEVTVYYPKFYNYFDPSMMDEYQFSFWYETLWVMDWGLNDADTYAFSVGSIPLNYLSGQLADTWNFDEDAGTLTVDLRQDVYFQDGAPYEGRQFVADDVVWSYSRLLGLNGMEQVDTEYDWPSALNMLAGVEATDEFTVVFTFNEGMNNTVSLESFMNAKVNIAGPEWDDCDQSDWHNAKGTGPYVLTDYVVDNSMTFTKNENYYDYDERYPENKLPYIDTINLVYIADSANILAQSMAGELDWFGENGKNVLSGDQLAQLSSANAGNLYAYTSSSPAAIALKVCQEQFSDVRVREAMQHAIDLEAANIYLGSEGDVVVPGLWATGMSWSTVSDWSDDLKNQFTYDPELAKELLTEAGYPDGFTFEIELDPTANLEPYQLAASYLQQVGITMNISVASEMMEAVQHSQDYDDARQSAGFGGGYGEYMLAFMMTGNGGMPNAYGHDDQDYLDKLNAMGAATSTEEQTKLAQELDQMFPANHWAILVAGVQPTYDFMSNRIGGYTGEKVYYKDNMRTIWARLWVEA
jgi:peptide/nickel transport system substrate-binding protein